MIVAIIRTRIQQCVPNYIVNVRKVNFNVIIRNVYHPDGDAITMRIVMMDRMKWIVWNMFASQINSSAKVVIVYRTNWSVMAIKIAKMYPMN